jgi:hypothetical protein
VVSDKEASVVKVYRYVRYYVYSYALVHILVLILEDKYYWLKPINSILFLFFAIACIAVLFLSFCDCPRCGKTFFAARVGIFAYANFFARKCLNCGLSIRADKQRIAQTVTKILS